MNLSIYSYESPSVFIKDAWESKRKVNKNFSLRSWAEKLGISSHGTFYQIIKGKRPLPKRYVQPISKSLNLSAKESLYLETLIDFSKAKTIEHKEYYSKRLKEIMPSTKRLSFYEIESYNVLKDPINGALIELTTLQNFKFDLKWIKKRLCFDITENELRSKLSRLLDLGLLQYSEKELKKTQEHIYTKQDVKNEALQEYHRNILKMGIDQISKQDVNKREYNATAFGIKHKDISSLKEDIRNFIKETITKYESEDGASEEIYQLGIQFFGLTNKENTNED